MSAGHRPVSWAALRQAVVWRGLRDALGDLAGNGGAPLEVVDAGGGSGGFAVPLAELGHRVVVVDPSPDSLASLERRAEERGVGGLVTASQGDLSSLLDVVPAGRADVVLCHNVLEVVDDPAEALAAVTRATRPGGLVSLLAANRAAVVVARTLVGRFQEAAAVLEDPAGRCGGHETPRRFDAEALVRLVERAGLSVRAVHGVRVFADLVPGSLLDADPAATDALLHLELTASGRSPYRDLATQLHVLARRP